MRDDHSHESHAGHNHGAHGHAHGPANYDGAFAFGIGLNVCFVLVELGVGVSINSLALIADAGHNATDVLGLLLAWGATALGRLPPKGRFTFGFGQATILASLANALLILIAAGVIGWEAVQRFANPIPPNGVLVMAVAAIGVVINLGTAWLFARGRKTDINIEGAFLHMLWDGLVSLSVIFAGGAILLTGQAWIDPAISLVIVAVMVAGTWHLLLASSSLSLGASPAGVDLTKVKDWLVARPGVASVHDLHVWPLSTTQAALSAHLVMPEGHPGDLTLATFAQELDEKFGLSHVTLQIEIGDGTNCSQASHGQ
ncbi:cation diffusion facilitator family transporter [Novosphingobium sp. PASSN1]|uniref:cation diffusion facilitator family transporter n=1 Tax=Novosphingobium sp. PASSN1 TaxID=2015561 RepID=UPI000BD28388|nr:cation diffusion facilitator family transporter [Novosphingobium sp. PASSN1]OYU33736.1 MAG: cation transporter [Novosphingobium sp. PASSN1]